MSSLSLTVKRDEPITIICKGEKIEIFFVEKHGNIGAVIKITADPSVKIIGSHVAKKKKHIADLVKLL